jgi:hypothetical protein
MKKGVAPIALILTIFFVIAACVLALRFFSGDEDTWICQNGQWVKHGNPSKPQPSSSCPDTQNSTVFPTNEKTSLAPLPTEEDVIRNFFNLINEGKPADAVMAMSKQNTENDSTKQAWAVQFEAIKSINILKIEKSMEENWTENSHDYKVTLEAYVSSESANAPIPYYGWGDNPNIRWIRIVKEDDLWKINGIATGP